ncbi:DUF3305 domain-containing protein [Oceanospirillum linum]|uniref:DUF3305 domain-containing protein n=1 Tax=Oceanospirillum linum TaxID=966 RepID=A0A1T1HD22_OCELI|nr:DUF3305 domain-containing protein [Oceanospirillum linum]OOV87702.1 hypothetical protein BTA35_0206700 [Oceanospirillum linum]SEG15140.1 Protein of unknown function [Oleiphilus messinensis]SMP11048.1 Protein of unknown function [Oceanospirillum linum]
MREQKQNNVRLLGIELSPLELRSGRWVLHEWQIDNLWPAPDPEPEEGHQELSKDGNPLTWLPLELHRDERSAYRFNLNSVVPHIFVLCDDTEDDEWLPMQITACQDLAASWLDGEQKVLEYPMPEALQCWIEAFITEHGELIEVKKKKRYAGDKADKRTANREKPSASEKTGDPL